jgi:hypothetical protein
MISNRVKKEKKIIEKPVVERKLSSYEILLEKNKKIVKK